MADEKEMQRIAKEDEMYNNNMTVFYSKNTGKIIEIVSGIHDFDYFSRDRQDKESYCLRAIYPKNNTIIFNSYNYVIDLETNKITYKPIDIVDNIGLEPIKNL